MQDSKNATRKARETNHIRINNPALNCNTGNRCIPEIWNNLLGVDRPSERPVQVPGLNLPKGHTHLTIPSNRFSRAVCLKIKQPEFHNLLNREPSCHQLASVQMATLSKFKIGAKEVLCTSRVCYINPFTLPKSLKNPSDSLVQTSPSKYVPIFKSSANVTSLSQLLIQSKPNVTFLAI